MTAQYLTRGYTANVVWRMVAGGRMGKVGTRAEAFVSMLREPGKG